MADELRREVPKAALRTSTSRVPWSRELAADEWWFSQWEALHPDCTCKLLTRVDSLAGMDFECRGEEG